MTEKRRSLLFFTNSEWGQANVILATIHEFLILDEFDIHLASYSALEPRLHDLLETHAASYPRPLRPSITFHTIPGLSVAQLCHRDGVANSLPHKPGLKGGVASYARLEDFFFRHTVDEYMEQQRYSKQVITQTQPVLILAEQGFSPGLDACMELNQPFTVLSPNSFKDFEQRFQPLLRILWKYPALASAFPFPVPLGMVPANVYLWVRMMTTIAVSASTRGSRLHTLNKGRHANGLEGPPPVMSALKKASHILCPSLPELDFPMLVRPTTIGCGPIVLPARPVSEVDPELDTWLGRSCMKTVLVNLGTHYSTDSALALEVARALKSALDTFPHVQILWKMIPQGEGQQENIHTVFGDDLLRNSRIRIEKWLKPDPVALLETGKVIAQVHHGGANTYFECCRFGVPQVILGAWWDTYEYAARVEYLGIGVFANKKAAPRAKTAELQKALLRAVSDDNMRAKANDLAAVCKRYGEGRVRARDRIREFIGHVV
ncbi:family 1 glycosyltransferase [Cryphonectria parasitica EP155]|uniref:Family 1 glycosyltransferase n=1 Tax=Cryphonectria parasitica (strain ATCC 38755 / EP155) TaxID=660469 RepID=A0A9P5CJR3_CRYP1|nr:family 1 glycosyltransferase [Cryphonectria parasitica EP155]KAF3760397.1 family 1 glycosyltransferase [Cryphonectria parasitica EP155]